VHSVSVFAHLFYQLTLRDLKARYKQTVLGALWAFGRPLVELGIYAAVFGVFLSAPSGGLPYPLFAYGGIVLWTFVAGALPRGTRSLTAHAALVARTPFPKATIPLAAVGAALVDAMLAALLLGAALFYYHARLSVHAFWIVPIGLVLVGIVAGLTLICSSLNVFYHDFGHLVDLGTRLWFLATPVVYAASAVPQRYRGLYELNPLAPLFEGARAALIAGLRPDVASFAYPAIVGAALLAGGTLLFRRAEPFFAESV
jgi:lipopolysaccharide transport system permease protein